MASDGGATRQLEECLRRKQGRLEAERREEERKATLSPMDLELEKIAKLKKYKNLDPWAAWLTEVEGGRWREEPDDERDVLERIKAAMEKAKKWKPRSSKKRPDKDKDHQRTLRVIKGLESHTER